MLLFAKGTSAIGGAAMKTALRDLRFALRQVRKNPGFAATAILILALGAGASTAIFSALKPILFDSLPYPQAGRIMMIWDIFEGARSDVTFHTYRELAERNRSFESLAVMEAWQPTMTGPSQPERLDGQSVSAGYFRVLGEPPALGRDFQSSDDQFKGPKVAILSDRLWRRRFGGDSTIVGRQVKLDDDLYTVVGVMPAGFENVLAPSAEIWSPMQYDAGHITNYDTSEWGHHLHMVGRLRAGVSRDQAGRELDVIAHAPVPQFPRARWASLSHGFIVDSLQREVTRGVKPALFAVLGAVMLLLLIACVNVTNLLLARCAAARRICHARRAGRRTITAGPATAHRESAARGDGGALGMLVAKFGIRVLVALSPPELPRVDAIRLDVGVFAFGVAITALIGLVVGLVPALQASRSDPHTALQKTSRNTAGARHQLTRRALVVAEVALALVLLVSAGLLLRSLERLFAVDPGFQPSHLLTMQVQTSGHRFDDDRVKSRFFQQALEGVLQVPGVSAAAFTSLLPLSGEQYGTYGTKFEDGSGYDVFRYAVSPGYFETTGIPLRRGRLLDAHDDAGAPPAVVISESLAKSQFPGRDPIGQRVHVGPTDRPWFTIVGVVGDVKQTSLAESDPRAVYITPAQSWFVDDAMSLVVRTRGDAASLAPAIRQAIWSVDKDQPIVRVATMDELLKASAAQRRFALIVFQAFALVGLVLAATGVYGVLAGSVTERTHEIGVRVALGASPADILALVFRQGMTLTGLGVMIGLSGAVAASSALITLLFGISRLDPVTYLGVIVLLLGVSGLACWVPARRAAQVDPAITLRAE
jgi:putative ABC transport system permease protein